MGEQRSMTEALRCPSPGSLPYPPPTTQASAGSSDTAPPLPGMSGMYELQGGRMATDTITDPLREHTHSSRVNDGKEVERDCGREVYSTAH